MNDRLSTPFQGNLPLVPNVSLGTGGGKKLTDIRTRSDDLRFEKEYSEIENRFSYGSGHRQLSKSSELLESFGKSFTVPAASYVSDESSIECD